MLEAISRRWRERTQARAGAVSKMEVRRRARTMRNGRSVTTGISTERTRTGHRAVNKQWLMIVVSPLGRLLFRAVWMA